MLCSREFRAFKLSLEAEEVEAKTRLETASYRRNIYIYFKLAAVLSLTGFRYSLLQTKAVSALCLHTQLLAKPQLCMQEENISGDTEKWDFAQNALTRLPFLLCKINALAHICIDTRKHKIMKTHLYPCTGRWQTPDIWLITGMNESSLLRCSDARRTKMPMKPYTLKDIHYEPADMQIRPQSGMKADFGEGRRWAGSMLFMYKGEVDHKNDTKLNSSYKFYFYTFPAL